MTYARAGLGAVVAVCVAAATAYAQDEVDVAKAEYWDVVETSDGSVWKGVIIEQIPNESYRIALMGGSVKVIAADEVVRITKEKNPNYKEPEPAPAPAPTPAPAPAPAAGGGDAAGAASLPAPMVGPGLRFVAGVGVAVPTSDWGEGDAIKAGPHLSLRVGTELMFDRFGVEPAGRFDFIFWPVDEDLVGADAKFYMIQAMANVRAKIHIGRVVPFFGLGVGLGVNLNDQDGVDPGLGAALNIEFGADILVNPGLGLGLAFGFHPGFVEAVDAPSAIDVSYWGFQASLVTY